MRRYIVFISLLRYVVILVRVLFLRLGWRKYAKMLKIETKVLANDYGQIERPLQNFNKLVRQLLAYVCFETGHHKLNQPAGYIFVLGLTKSDVKLRDVDLCGSEDAVDWLFY